MTETPGEQEVRTSIHFYLARTQQGLAGGGGIKVSSVNKDNTRLVIAQENTWATYGILTFVTLPISSYFFPTHMSIKNQFLKYQEDHAMFCLLDFLSIFL